ncbi:peptidoglycan D,D-transpeptidase FtsI family protein [Chlamydiifrater phoenicopteri]|uniref:peptidoglycan D,D-transpeptidase FtsI family protein n=1 Tax=Chlamydiifrater phoenicopteri TaxID=2681469 RepID=UPI001BD0698E|nr:penicillin-binding protein 2 [Chlamydiifrater phoenicopteri]
MRKKKRLIFVVIGLFVFYSLLIARYYEIQILSGDKWAAEATMQHEFRVKEPFRRGTFFASTLSGVGVKEDFRPLVFDLTKFHIFLDPASIPDSHKEEIAERLVSLVGEGSKDFICSEMNKKSRSRKVFTWQDKECRQRILSWWRPFALKNKIPSNAIYFVTDYRRSYPAGKLLGQVLHTIREVKDEKTGRAFPTGGLEAYFNHILEGESGERKLLRSPLNRLELDQVIKMPKDGADIFLTINHHLQTIAEEELEKGVLAAKARGGRVIMMDPSSGEILALAQYPFFDPSDYKEYFNDKERIEYTKVSMVSDVFEPGSIMKPITVAIALKGNEELVSRGEQPLFSPQDPMDVTRTTFPGRASKPLRDITPRKKLNMYMAIQKSSNVYMAQLADRIVNRLGAEWYRDQLLLLGFGDTSGIELPAEASGVVPSPKRFHANGSPEWSVSTPYSLAMGYNIMATGVQMAAAYSTLLNGGYLVRPTLIKEIRTSNGQCYAIRKERGTEKLFSDSVVLELVKAMRLTTMPGGTGVRASLKGFSSGGKTGTSEKIFEGKYCKNRHISSFIGFCPANFSKNILPRFVLLVSIDDPAHIILEDGTKNYMGGRCAAPVFSAIASRALPYLGVSPENEEGACREFVRSLKQLFEEWNR